MNEFVATNGLESLVEDRAFAYFTGLYEQSRSLTASLKANG
jgi:hypothetical protein